MESGKDHYDVLKDSLFLFSKYLVAEDFIDLLIQDNVLSLDDKELITNPFIHQTRRQRATKLIELLMLRGQHGYDVFMEYVEYLYPHVYTMVTNKGARHPPPHLVRNRESDKLRLINDLPNLAQQIKDQWHVNKELDTELTVLQHILEYAKEENMALEKEIESLKETKFENETLKLQIVTLEREKNEHQVFMNKEMLRTFDYIKERDELQEKLRDLQVQYDTLYKQNTHIGNVHTSKPNGATDAAKKPPIPESMPVKETIRAHIDVEKKILKDKLEESIENSEDLTEKLRAARAEIERLEEKANRRERELKKQENERSNLQKHLNDSTVKCESYFEIIQKKDKELLENQSQKMKAELKFQELLQSKNELFETNHRLERKVKDLQYDLDKIKARQSSSSVDIDNSSSFNSASEEESGEENRGWPGTRKPRRQQNLKKKAFRDGRYSSRHAVFGGEGFTNIDTITTDLPGFEDSELPDYYKASTLPATTNETSEMVFRRECAMFRYTMKDRQKSEKKSMTDSMTVQPSNSIRIHNRDGDSIIPEALQTRKEPRIYVPCQEATQDDSGSSSTVLVPRAAGGGTEHPVAPPKPAHLQWLAKGNNLPKKQEKSGSNSEEEEGSGSVTDNSNRSSTSTNASHDSSLSADFPCWEVSTHILPKQCARVDRPPGILNKHMCREVVLKYPLIGDKIVIKGGNHTGIYISKVLKPSNISEGEEIRGIVYVPSQRNKETTTSLEGCTLEDTYKLLSEEYISWKKEKEVKIQVKNCHQEYDSASMWMEQNNGNGDYVFVRCNMNVGAKSTNEVSLKQGDIYLITNTMIEQHKWLGKKINQATGELDPNNVILPNLQQANIRRPPLPSEKRRGVIKLRGQCYDRVLPMTASIKLPVYVVGPEKIVNAVIDVITADLSSTFVRMEADTDKRASEPLQDVHYVTDGLSDTKSQSKSHGRIYIFINVTSAMSSDSYICLFGPDFPVQSLDDPLSRSSRIKQHLVSNSITYENVVLDSITSRIKLVSMVKEVVATSQKRLTWLSAEEMDESVAKKYVKYLGQDLSQVMMKVQRANSLDQS